LIQLPVDKGGLGVLKLRLLSIVLFLFVLKVAAQSPQQLLAKIQRSKSDTNRIRLQLKLGSYYLYKPGEFKDDLDSAYNYFNLATQLSNKLREVEWQYRTLALTGDYYAEAGNLERGKQCFMRVIAYYHQTGNISKEANAWQQLGDLYDNNGKNNRREERISYYQHARSLYLKNHQPLNAIHALKDMADVQLINKQYKLAEIELQQVLTQYKKLGYKNLQDTYDMLSTLEYAKGNYYRAMTYVSEGIRSAKASGDTGLVANFYQAFAKCNYAVKKYNEALEWIRKAVIADKGDVTYKCVLVQTLVALNRAEEARVALNDISRKKPLLSLTEKANLYRVTALYYDKINKNDLAVRYNIKILELGLKKGFSEEFYNIWSVICNNEIAGIYLKANQAAKAEKYLNNAALIFKNAKTPLDPRFLVAFYDHLYKYDFATGNYRSAVKNLEQHDRIQDSLFTADKDNKISELNIQYETAQKEQSIKNLHSQSAVQQARLEKANLQRNITIVGILIMMAISTLFYKNYKQKQLANNIITQKNELLQHLLMEKNWLLKEVHHRVKNNLHTVICLLESQAAYLENDALKAIESSQHRIYAMSLIHQKLYQSDDIKIIDMSDYIHELVQSLQDSFDTSDQIQFKLNINPINLTLSHAIPLGLIINEAVTNSIKYAFPGKCKGEISISMVDDGKQIKFELADNGIGMPQIDFEIESHSLGLELMKGLSEDIDADISFQVDNGTRITVIFKPDELNSTESILRSSETEEVYI
jgi:two-component sensor histidine kinase